jgi:ABC-type bacteriocin/lantibiotic exporter with double-glycine peptidase domain
MVLEALGHTLTEAEIRQRCGHTKGGMRLNQVAGGLKDLPVIVEYHTDWSRDDLRDAIRQTPLPIVGVDLRLVDGIFAFHAVVVLDLIGDGVRVLDPLQGERTLGLASFEAAWNNADHEVVVITHRPSQ